MVVGDLVAISNTQTTGWENGTIGICIKVEPIGLFTIYWLHMSTGEQVPFWSEEVELFNKSGRLDSGDRGVP